MTQTSFDLVSAGMRNPTVFGLSYPFLPTPMDDSYEDAVSRQKTADEIRSENAIAEFEANLAR